MKCPCTKNCPERSATCHSECERYLHYEKIKESENRKKHRLYQEEYDMQYNAVRMARCQYKHK